MFGVRTRVKALGGDCGARQNTQSSTGTGTVLWFTIPYIPDLLGESTVSALWALRKQFSLSLTSDSFNNLAFSENELTPKTRSFVSKNSAPPTPLS